VKSRRLGGVIAFWIAFLAALLYLAGKMAMSYHVGISYREFQSGFMEIIRQPFVIKAAAQSAAFCMIAVVIWLVLLASYMVSYGKYMQGREHGSADWGNIRRLRKKFEQQESIILSQNLGLGLDTHIHHKNLNVLLVGGSGSGKTRGYVLPNLMQGMADYIVTDPKGEILRSTGGMLEAMGYRIRVLNLIDMEKSNRYNPLAYAKSDTDVMKIVTDFIKNTTDKQAQKGEQFWQDAERALMQAFLLYLYHEAPSWEQNFGMVPTLLQYMVISEDDEGYVSPLDKLFNELEKSDTEHIAVKLWRLIRNSPARTLKSIRITMASRINKFLEKKMADLLSEDEFDLRCLGSGQKTAIFCVLPDNDTTFNFIAGMLYSQLIKELYYKADHSPGGALERPVLLVLDEFPNVALPDDFDLILATCRSRGVSISIVIQNLSQLKALYKDKWENIVGNCNTMVYLGGSEQATREYVSKALGKATINYQTTGKSSQNSNTNINITGRELMMPDEIRTMKDDECLVLISGEKPILDKKFNLMKHKNIGLVQPGGASAYLYSPKRMDSYEDWKQENT
jgi:type IV secretion system protein VirD4